MSLRLSFYQTQEILQKKTLRAAGIAHNNKNYENVFYNDTNINSKDNVCKINDKIKCDNESKNRPSYRQLDSHSDLTEIDNDNYNE